MSVGSFLARRFVAGETALEAVAAAQRMQARGIRSILDYLGEHVSSVEEARAAVAEYLQLLDRIQERAAGASISLKASQMGVLVSQEICLENLMKVAERAAGFNLTMWMDMEGSALTQKTIEVFEQLRNKYPNVGLCLQAYLVRTGGDLDRLMRKPLKVRLCKGAYNEPASIAYTSKRAVDGSFRMLASKISLEGFIRRLPPTTSA
jgi:proline dehydrogenase